MFDFEMISIVIHFGTNFSFKQDVPLRMSEGNIENFEINT